MKKYLQYILLLIFIFNGSWNLGDVTAAKTDSAIKAGKSAMKKTIDSAAKTDSAIKAGKSAIKKTINSASKNIKSTSVEEVKDALKDAVKETVKRKKADCKMFMTKFLDNYFRPLDKGFTKIYQPIDILQSNFQ